MVVVLSLSDNKVLFRRIKLRYNFKKEAQLVTDYWSFSNCSCKIRTVDKIR